MSNTPSVLSFQEQYAFELDVDVQKGEKITGGFGKTFYRAKRLDREELPVVLIEINGNKMTEEVLLYITLHHPHIIETYGLVEPNGQTIDSNSILLLQEYAEDGDLGSMLSNQYFVPQQNVLLEIFIQVADAMVFLSKQDLIHGDLACRNVVIFKSHPHNPKNNLVKLIDFGSTRDKSKSLDAKIDIPVRYVAPEILRSNGRSGYTEKSEVYSFAVLMHEACSFGKIPYENINDDVDVWRQKLEDKRLTRPDKCDSNIWKLMNICWNDKPDNRPNFQTIHTQLKNIQNVESSSPHSNSIFLPSSLIEGNSCLFQIEHKICYECNLRYTDYDSHLNNCREHELKCYKCGKQYRRASFDNHNENCDDLLFDDSNNVLSPGHLSSSEESLDQNRNHDRKYSTPTSVSSQSNNRSSSRSNPNTNSPYNLLSASSKSCSPSLYQTDKNTRGFQEKPSFSSKTAVSLEPVKTRSTNIREKPSQLNTIQLPCEICEKLIDASHIETHQRQCYKIDKERVEDRRRIIEEQQTVEKAECTYCHQSNLIHELINHENICPSNPRNVPDELPRLSAKPSISVLNLRDTAVFSKIPTPSNKSTAALRNDHRSKSTDDLSAMESVENKKRSSFTTNKELSGFRKLVSRLWPFKNKGSVK